MVKYPELENAFRSMAADQAAQIGRAQERAMQIDDIETRIVVFLRNMPGGKFRAQWVSERLNVTLDDVLAVLADDRHYIDLDDGYWMLAATYAHYDDQIKAARERAMQIDDIDLRIKTFMDALPPANYQTQWVAYKLDVPLLAVLRVMETLLDDDDLLADDTGHDDDLADDTGHDDLADDDDDLADDSDYWDKERCVQCQEVIHGQNFDGLCEACYEYYTRRDDDLADDTGHDDLADDDDDLADQAGRDDLPEFGDLRLWTRYIDYMSKLDYCRDNDRIEIHSRINRIIARAMFILDDRAAHFTISARPDTNDYAIIILTKNGPSLTYTARTFNDLIVTAAHRLVNDDRP